MSRARRRKDRPLQNGRSAQKQPQYLMLRYEMLSHQKFKKLPGRGVKVLLELCRLHNGFNNGKIVCSYDDLAKPLGLGKATVGAALADLEKAGFIVCIKKGYFTGRMASVWEITFLRSEGYTPTDLWKDLEQRPCRPHLTPVRQDLIQEVLEMPEMKNTKQVPFPNTKESNGSELEP